MERKHVATSSSFFVGYTRSISLVFGRAEGQVGSLHRKQIHNGACKCWVSCQYEYYASIVAPALAPEKRKLFQEDHILVSSGVRDPECALLRHLSTATEGQSSQGFRYLECACYADTPLTISPTLATDISRDKRSASHKGQPRSSTTGRWHTYYILEAKGKGKRKRPSAVIDTGSTSRTVLRCQLFRP